MNNIWSKYVQGTKTLYYSRKLRFDDMFAEQYKMLFGLDKIEHLKILEIGCGPGALAGALHRWYPNADITAIDRDSEFIHFAREHESGIAFMEGDITSLPYEDNSFDVIISNTVSEHIEPSKFYGEQIRVLKEGGICLVLSSRKGIIVTPSCTAASEYEKNFWKKVERYDDTMDKYSVCKYAANEAELPLIMERYGLKNIRTGFAAIGLTPDDPKFSETFAHKMMEADRYTDLDRIESVLYTMPEYVTMKEAEKMRQLINEKYDTRIAQYDRGEKQWDTKLSIIMIVRGVKLEITESDL